jgi:hypothetical protein
VRNFIEIFGEADARRFLAALTARLASPAASEALPVDPAFARSLTGKAAGRPRHRPKPDLEKFLYPTPTAPKRRDD